MREPKTVVPNGDEPLLKLPDKVCAWLWDRQKQTKNHHKVNAWMCKDCGGLTVCKDIHEGVTPMFLACRASGDVEDCRGMAVSSGYPETPPPLYVLEKLAWEWYRPSQNEFDNMDAPVKDHVLHGGLNLRRMKGK